MWFTIREVSRGRRGKLYALVSPIGRVVPWYPNNAGALLPLDVAERQCSEYNRRALSLPPMWQAFTGVRWEAALREIYGLTVGEDGRERWSVVGVEDTGHKTRRVKRQGKQERQSRKAVKEYLDFAREARKIFPNEPKTCIVVEGMSFKDKSP